MDVGPPLSAADMPGLYIHHRHLKKCNVMIRDSQAVAVAAHGWPGGAAAADVAVGHPLVGASRKHQAGKKVEDECVKAVGRMLIGVHSLLVCFAILGCCFAVVVDKP